MIQGHLTILDYDTVPFYPGRFNAVDGLGRFSDSLHDGVSKLVVISVILATAHTAPPAQAHR
jgi:hypothetical protein